MEKPQFPPALWRELASQNPLGRKDITPQDAKDWFEMVWPRMRGYMRPGRPNHRRRLWLWWSRLRPDELARSRELAAERRRSERARELAQVAEKYLPPPQASPPREIPPLRVSRGAARD